MQKSVYSLVLMDDVVREVDRLAYSMNTSRSNMINQILAEYVSYMTPEKKMQEVFHQVEQLLTGPQHFQLMMQPSDTMISLRSALDYKYNPTVRYSVELFRTKGPTVGELKVSLRSQNSTLILYISQFFRLWKKIEDVYLGGRECQIREGRFFRTLYLTEERNWSNTQIGDVIAGYIQLVDTCLKLYFENLQDPQEAARLVEKRYAAYLREGGSVL